MTWHPDMPEEYRNQIVTGDAIELAKRLPDESIDLIFTDPIYDRIEDYDWLAIEGERILKSHGLFLVWSNGKWHHKNTLWLAQSGLTYRWTFTYINNDTFAPMCGKIISKSNRVIWLDLDGQSKIVKYVPDGYIGYGHESNQPRVNFRWYKSAPYTDILLRGFTTPQNVIFDPFCGSGVTSCSAIQLNRNYVAFEIDPETAGLARERVRNTQPPLFVMEPEQLELGSMKESLE